jgi:hypothetical protein
VVTIRPITKRDLLDVDSQLPPEVIEAGLRVPLLAGSVITHFLGMNWFNKHVRQSGGHLSISDDDGVYQRQMFRMTELAETLLNLQHIDGFDDLLDRMLVTHNPEPELAELHIGKMLYVNDWPFRFVKRQGRRGADFDLVSIGSELLTRIGSEELTTLQDRLMKRQGWRRAAKRSAGRLGAAAC